MLTLLDCTLRDGAHLNSGLFGDSTISKVVDALSASSVGSIEVGFLTSARREPGSTYFESASQAEELISSAHSQANYFLMTRPDWISPAELGEPSARVRGLRIAFRQKDTQAAIDMAEVASDVGFEVHLNPINTPIYEDHSLSDLLSRVNPKHASYVSIVDTFGQMHVKQFTALLERYDFDLPSEIGIGLHLHENLALSHAFVVSAVEKLRGKNRNVSIDGALAGMGRAPGNFPTELLALTLNRTMGSNHDLETLFACAINVVDPLRGEAGWGYRPIYALSAVASVDRTYAEQLDQMERRENFPYWRVLHWLANEGFFDFDSVALDNAIRAVGNER